MTKPYRSSSRSLPMAALLSSALAVILALPVAADGSGAFASAIRAAKPHRHVVLFGIDPLWAAKPTTTINTQLRRMRAIGLNSVRIEANWRSTQTRGPGASNLDWNLLDREVSLAGAARMTIDLVIDGCPPWAAIPHAGARLWPQPKSAGQYAAFAAAVANRYKSKGVNRFEIWNEPNDSKFFQPVANAVAYTKMLIAAYNAIKKVDNSAFVISGGLAPVLSNHGSYSAIAFLKAMYAHGAKGHFDAVGDHSYSFPALPNTYRPWSAWTQMSRTKPSIRSIMTAHGDAGKRIWITEYGAPSQGPKGVGQKAQAAEMAQAIIDAKRTSWIGAIYLYTWQDLGTNRHGNADWFGLLDFGGRRKKAYWAVKAAI